MHVDHATWVHNVGLKPLGISIFQRREGDRFATFGSWRGYPPENPSHDGGPTMAAAWARRVPAQGATLPVTSDPEQHYFNILVSFTGVHGSAGPVHLSYTDADGHHGTVDTLVTVRILPTCP